MSGTYLTLTNNTLARLNEVQLTSTTFTSARGIQVQAKNAVNESIRYINQKEFSYPFNHATETKTLTAGTVRYSLPTSTKHVDYNTFRLVKDEDLGNSGGKLGILQYNDYINNYIKEVESESGKKPDLNEICQKLKISKKRAIDIIESTKAPASLDDFVGSSNDSSEGNTLFDVIEDKNCEPVFDTLAQKERAKILNIFLNKLNERERAVLQHRFGLENQDRETLEKIGLRFNVTRERIRQIENIALRKLKLMIKRFYKTEGLAPFKDFDNDW